MRNFFAKLYEWFGLIPLYARDLGDHLKGFDETCMDYIGTPYYVYIGIAMIIVTVLFYILQYHVINSSRFNKLIHWWIIALIAAGVNFFIAFILPFTDLQKGNYCRQLNIAIIDCLGFAASNAIWSFILFLLLTSFPFPRNLAGHNMTETTFWKPKP